MDLKILKKRDIRGKKNVEIAEEVNGIITDVTQLDDSERGLNYGW